ncbi:MAG: DUF167 domain-containing protein [Ferrovum sp.]|nr:DUF167 domain-containing protein [Ferrovum sp.]NDU87147.1 DUF167 domain-containing protein [Ferrovum sp.]
MEVCRRHESTGDWVIRLHIQPGAKSSAVVGLHGEALKIRLAAPPVDGKANDTLCRFLADRCRLPLRAVVIGTGLTGRRKQVILSGFGERDPVQFLLSSEPLVNGK